MNDIVEKIKDKTSQKIGTFHKLQEKISKLKQENDRLRSTFLERQSIKEIPPIIPEPQLPTYTTTSPEIITSSTTLELILIINNIIDYVKQRNEILSQYKHDLDKQNQELLSNIIFLKMFILIINYIIYYKLYNLLQIILIILITNYINYKLYNLLQII